MRIRALLILAMMASVVACAAPGGPPPSLLPRTAESIDPRLPVPGPVNDRPVTPALAGRLAELIAEARSGDAAFRPLVERAEQLAAAAGDAQGEGWVAAQQALSAAIAARAPTARALGDIDALGANRLQTQGGLSPADLAAIATAGAEVGEIDARQTAAIDAVQQRLSL
jgi:hypothetical protein